MLFVFGVGPLRGAAELAMDADGAPSHAALEQCRVQSIARGRDQRWFDAWRSGSLRAIAAHDLGARLGELDACDHVHVVTSAPGEVSDLTYLQAAWALVRHVIERGGSLVLDAHAMTYLTPDAIAPAGAPLDVAREVRVVFETSPARGEHAHALHTRGMRKFGAPDLIALCGDDDVALVGPAIRELADQVARGTDLATPRHAVEVGPGVRWVAVEDEHLLADLLQLNNRARVLVDERGHDLIGVVRTCN
jgi:hypothetical protein